MAHGDYDCCACCDRKMAYSNDADTKEVLCAHCAIALMEQGVKARSGAEFLAWLETATPETARPILEAVGFSACFYPNPVDAAVYRLTGITSGTGRIMYDAATKETDK